MNRKQRNSFIKVLNLLLFATQIIAGQTPARQTAKSLPLQQVWELAIFNSKQLKLAKTGVERAQQATQLVRTAQTPSLDASLSALYLGNAVITNRDFTNAQSFEMPHFGNNFAIEATQVIFAGGAIFTNIKKAKLEEQMAQLNYDRNELDICFLVTGYYLNLYKLSNQREVFLKNIDQTKLLIEQIKSKEAEGMALGSDVTRQELMLQNLKLALIEVDNNSKIINNQLVVTLGLSTETVIVPDSITLNLDMSKVSQEQLMQQASENLPELKSATLNKEIASKEVRISKADYYPQIALVAADNFNGPILIEVPPLNNNLNYWYVGIGIKYNLASFYKSNRKVQLANKRVVEAQYGEALALEHTQIAVNSSYIKFMESYEKLEVYQTNVRLANENYRIINNRYLSEQVLITEMLDASNIKLNAELQVVNAKLDVVYNYYWMQREIGKRGNKNK